MEDAVNALLSAEVKEESIEVQKRKQGIVIWFDPTKCYGFIKPRDGGGNVFVHHSEIRTRGFRTLSPDQPIEFDVEEHPKGPRAVNVVPLQ